MMAKYLIILIFTITTGYSQCLQLDILVVADLSGSTNNKHEHIINGLNAFVNRFDLAEDKVKISPVIFAKQNITLSRLSSNKQKLIQSIDSIGYYDIGQSTYMHDALVRGLHYFTMDARIDSQKIIVIVSDGDVAYPAAVRKVINIAKSSYYYQIYSVYLYTTTGSKPQFMREIASEGGYLESSYELLFKALEALDMCF